MKNFLVISVFLILHNLFALYIPKNLKPFYLKQHNLNPAVLINKKISFHQQYVKLFFYFSQSPEISQLKKLGIIKLFGNATFFSAYVPYNNLDKLETLSFLSSVKRPDKPAPSDIQGEEINLYNAPSFTEKGFDGTGVNVAIVDVGFYKYQEAINAGELPSDVVLVNYSSTAIDAYDDANSQHGTAVAEVVHEIAPKAKLHLIKIDDSSGFLSLKDYCVEHQIQIINHSVGWFSDGWGSGDGWIYNEIVSPLFDKNILWVNSAGNSALSHYQAVFNDNGSGWHKFESGSTYGVISNVGVGDSISLILKWNAYSERSDGQTYSDYDLFLYDSGLTEVASSADRQNPYYPDEFVEYTATSSGNYYYRVKQYNASYPYEFQVFSYSHDLSPVTISRSLVSPSDGPKTLCVGAISYSNWNKSSPEIESFSSQGPSQDGRTKPDIVGIDGMLNYTYGRFSGTSASSPSVAGLGALILSKQSYLSSYQLFYTLKDNAIDIGASGDDNIYGAGKVNIKLIPFLRNNTNVGTNIIVAPTRIYNDEYLYYYGISEDMTITLRDVLGRYIKEYDHPTGVYVSGQNKIKISDLNLVPGIYLIEFKTEKGKKYVEKIIVYSH